MGSERVSVTWNRIVLIHCCVILLFVAFWLYLQAAPASLQIPRMSIALIGLSVWFYASWWLATGSWFDPYTLFLAAALVFNAGQVFLATFGLLPTGILDNRFSVSTLADTLTLVSFGLLAFHTGALFSSSRRRQGEQPVEADASKQLRQVGFVLIGLALIPTLFEWREALQVVTSSGYIGLYQRTSPTGPQGIGSILANFIVPGAMFLLVGSKRYQFGRVVAFVVVLLHAGSLLFLGYRAWAAMPVLAFMWLWHRRIRPLPLPILAGIATGFLFVVFPTIRAVRSVPAEARAGVDSFLQAFSLLDSPAISSVAEMGTSMRTVAHTLELVPAYRSFAYGVEYLYMVSTVFPNVFWDIHPAIAYGLPSRWLALTIDPISAARGVSPGYSFIAEAFLNFGWFGILALLLIGVFMGRVVAWGDQANRPLRLAMLASWTSFLLLYARAEFNLFIRPLVWYSLAPYLLAHFLLNWRRLLRPGQLRTSADIEQPTLT